MNDGRLRAREYRRLSDAKGGTSIDDQGVDNGEAADENDWDLGEPYVDEGLSASRYARRRRDDFDQLVSDLQSGPTGRESRFGADILMLWESSRGSRRVGEWVSFIELCEEKGVRIWVSSPISASRPSRAWRRSSERAAGIAFRAATIAWRSSSSRFSSGSSPG